MPIVIALPALRISYYTDPACPDAWALEPVRRRLEVDFGADLQITYVMSGLAREFGPPVEQIRAWLEAGSRSGMPVDPRVWLEGPPASSYPACLAVEAAAEQGDPGRFLRRLREGFAYGRRKLDTTEALVEEARAAGLDVARFRIDLASNAIVEAFGADLDRRRAHDAPLPFFEIEGVVVAGEDLPRVEGGARPGVEEALTRFGTLATAEVAAVCGLPGPRAPAELWRLATEWRVRHERAGSDHVWSVA